MGELHLIDTHCHLDFTEFDIDREEVINRAFKNGVRDIIVPSVAKSRWLKTISVCNDIPHCHLALGLHPVFINEHRKEHLLELQQLIETHSPIAIGEIGLDFYIKSLDKERQRDYFIGQLKIAEENQLPVIIHNRKAHDDAIKLLKQFSLTGGIIHAFNGSIQQAEKYIDLGFLLGFGGMLTFDRSNKLRKLVQAIPLQSIVLETDAPDMTVSAHKGERNSPEYLNFILDIIADLKQQSCQQIASSTSYNVKNLFQNMDIK